ncbi:TonB-dependent receptor [Malaciobacter mytili LMG 24559]|uniref:TonB-dependent receptor n=1 Tax=Malaciobacter mytili LMG 24559 TaxID=1032238 RepID=A0AAX2AF64_9BACT|nr:TonB-dependent receptor [Malaciobacter mytili]AXH15123.1 TonB-dependent receptor [Malaciobacter mytili LMG 24559]RXK15632.1 TonB-dependent receptor [Malaciobacter mytili LMG 24559]
MKQKLPLSLVASFFLATTTYANYQISPITITGASKTEQTINNVTSNVEVITKEEIEERNFTTVSEALTSVSGISFTSNGSVGNTTSIFLRGMSSNRILVLVDGIRYQDPSNTSGASFENLMASDIERIEVIKGAYSGIYGSDASAGVINIITKNAKEGLNASINAEAGSYLTKKYGMTLSNKEEKYDFKISANRFLTKGFSSQIEEKKSEKDFERDGYQNTTVNLKTNYYLTSDDRVGFIYNYINSNVEYDDFNAPNAIQRAKSRTNLYSVFYTKKYKNHDIKVKYDLSKFKKSNLDATFGVNGYTGKTKILELTDTIFYNKKDFIIAGLSKEEYKVDYSQVSGSSNQDKNTNKAIFFSNTNSFDKLLLNQTLRRDSYSNFDDEVTGKVGFRYDFMEKLSLSSNYGTAYNAPNIIKILNPWGISNPNLKPEKSKGYDVTLNYKNLSLTYFNNKVEDLISWESNQYVNTSGVSRFKGIEAKYTNEIFQDTLLSLNYTHLSAKNENKEPLARRPKRQLGFSLDYYGFTKLHLNLNGSYVGTRYDKVNNSGEQTGRYTLFNSVINYELDKKTKIYLKLENLTDKFYQTIDGYATAGRSIYAGLKVDF